MGGSLASLGGSARLRGGVRAWYGGTWADGSTQMEGSTKLVLIHRADVIWAIVEGEGRFSEGGSTWGYLRHNTFCRELSSIAQSRPLLSSSTMYPIVHGIVFTLCLVSCTSVSLPARSDDGRVEIDKHTGTPDAMVTTANNGPGTAPRSLAIGCTASICERTSASPAREL